MGKAAYRLLVLGAASDCVPWLHEQAFEVEQVDQISEGLERLSRQHFDLALLNVAISDGSGLDFFGKARALAPQVPILVLTRPEDEQLALETLQLGAQDYFLNTEPNKLLLAGAIRKAIERHHAQDASRRDQHLLEILMNKIPDAIYFKDVDSRFLRINRAHARRFSLADPTLATGKTDADFFIGSHAQQARADEQQVMNTGLPLVGIEEMETWPDGTISWVSTTKMPLRDFAGRIIGTFGISRDITPRKEAELALAERTRQLRQKNLQMEEEMKMARELQQAMLPQRFPCVPSHGDQESALEFFSFYSPSGSVSGDFFDVVELSDTAVGMFICDVMGHDVRAALVTAMMRALVEDLSQAATDPGQLLAQINRGLTGIFRQTGTTMFATAFYLIADVASSEMRYASAAHPDALHLHRSQGIVDPLHADTIKKGPALGLFEEAEFPTCRRPMASGDMILLFTDGLIEAEDAAHECFTQERLTTVVRRHVQLRANDLFKQVIGELKQFCGGAAFNDDVSMLGMEVRRLERS
jgi:sigma-B regulation protein RsbU (phosphoserine phosphatase)